MKPVCILTTADADRPATDDAVNARWFFDPTVALNNVENNVDATRDRMPVYSILIRGPDMAELKLAKRCLKLAVLACFNGTLESAYMRDACIIPKRKVRMNKGLAVSHISSGMSFACTQFHNSLMTLCRFPFLQKVKENRQHDSLKLLQTKHIQHR